MLDEIPKELLLTPETLPKTSINGKPRPFLAYRDTRRATLLVKRTVIGPFVNRHNLDEDTITIQVNGDAHIRVPNRKFKAVEKARVLRAARMAGLVPAGYLTNEVQEVADLANPVSIAYGDGSNKQNEVAGIPSRILHSQGVSVQTRAGSIVQLTHNALSDERTMRNVADREKGKTTMRTSLFETSYVKEGTVFLSTLTIDTPTKDLLAVALYGLQAGSYGAGTAVYGTNIRNDLEGIAFTHRELPFTPWSILQDNPTKEPDAATKSLVGASIESSKDGHFLDSVKAKRLQEELAGTRQRATQALQAILAHCPDYIETVFGKSA